MAALSIPIVVLLASPAAAAITTVPSNATGAGQLTAALAAPGFPAGAASFSTVPPSGTPHGIGDSSLGSFPTTGSTFAILTTGDASLADDPNTSGSSGVSDGGSPVRGDTDRDVTVLKIPFTVPPSQNCLTFDFRFLSDEYPEYVNSSFNDAFIAELDTSNWTTSGSTISAPNNFAFDPANQVISINAAGNTSMTAAEAAGTTYDGATPRLAASTPVTAGPHALYFSIFDQGDNVLDSAVFLDGLALGFVPNPNTQCVPGATPFDLTLTPATATRAVGTQHTVTAKLTQGGNALAGKAIKFTVTGVNPTTGTGTTNVNGQATFTYTGNNPGSDNIVACFDETNNGDCEASASASVQWGGDTTKPACALTNKTSTGIEVTTRDTGSGLKSIAVITSTNATVNVPPFTVGTKNPVVVTATKVNTSQPSQVGLRVTDVAGNVTDCDPVVATLVKEKTPQIFTNVPHAEHFVTVVNESPGLRRIRVTVNGTAYRRNLRPGQEITIDVIESMKRGPNNTFGLRGWGKGSADITIWDGKSTI